MFKRVSTFIKLGTLSSFSRFRRHKDEQRLDREEGMIKFINRTEEKGGQTIIAEGGFGRDAYVLCATAAHSKRQMKRFRRDSYIRINESVKFGYEVAKKIPGIWRAFEGLCLYSEHKIVEKDLGYVDLERTRNPDGTYPADPFFAFIMRSMGQMGYFLKHKRYSPQVEYRYLWLTDNEPKDFLDIKVPEAIRFCSRPKLTDF